MMPNIAIIDCKLKQKFESWKKNKQSKNGQSTYQVQVSIQFRGKH